MCFHSNWCWLRQHLSLPPVCLSGRAGALDNLRGDPWPNDPRIEAVFPLHGAARRACAHCVMQQSTLLLRFSPPLVACSPHCISLRSHCTNRGPLLLRACVRACVPACLPACLSTDKLNNQEAFHRWVAGSRFQSLVNNVLRCCTRAADTSSVAVVDGKADGGDAGSSRGCGSPKDVGELPCVVLGWLSSFLGFLFMQHTNLSHLNTRALDFMCGLHGKQVAVYWTFTAHIQVGGSAGSSRLPAVLLVSFVCLVRLQLPAGHSACLLVRPVTSIHRSVLNRTA
eukprot:SAG22_NODE_1121_length_5508_cov_6.904234_5_plen_283_part_00